MLAVCSVVAGERQSGERRARERVYRLGKACYTMNEDGRVVVGGAAVVVGASTVVTPMALVAPFVDETSDDVVALRPGTQIVVEYQDGKGKRRRRRGRLAALHRPADATETARVLTSGTPWAFGHDADSLALDIALGLAVVVVDRPLDALPRPPRLVPARVTRGQRVRVIGAPFALLAPEWTHGALASGIVANVAGASGLFFVDAPSLPGSAGGPCVDADDGRLLGIVLPAWRRMDGPCGLTPVLGIDAWPSSWFPPAAPPLSPAAAVPGIVLVRSQSVWGSGLVLGPRLVLTNRHVLADDDGCTVVVGERAYAATVVFRADHDGPDVAVVRTLASPSADDGWPAAPPRSRTVPRVGDAVQVIGFGLFSDRLGPSLRAGIVSAVVGAYVSCDAPIHQGDSGGVLVDANGACCALVCCNTMMMLASDGSDASKDDKAADEDLDDVAGSPLAPLGYARLNFSLALAADPLAAIVQAATRERPLTEAVRRRLRNFPAPLSRL